MELRGHLEHQAWGKIGTKSVAGLFYWHSRKRNLLNKSQHYSAIVFSAYPKSETILTSNYEYLYAFIQKQPQVLGKECAKLFKNMLPLQIKLISLQHSMGLLCHPNGEHAKRLSQLYPKRYMDHNHKPKLVIALSQLEIYAGFKAKEDIFPILKSVPELAIVIPYERIEDYLHSGKEKHLKEIFRHLINASELELKLSLDTFFTRMRQLDDDAEMVIYYSVLKRLHSLHHYDCGVFVPFFLNHIILNSGESVFIPSGIVHTYITGDCFEVSTYSRNVLRFGFTDNFKHTYELMKVADFAHCKKEKLIFKPNVVDIFLTSYITPVPEFAANRLCVPDKHVYTLPTHDCCSIVFVTRGSAVLHDSRVIKLGSTLFMLPHQTLTFTVKADITIYTFFPNPNLKLGAIGCSDHEDISVLDLFQFRIT